MPPCGRHHAREPLHGLRAEVRARGRTGHAVGRRRRALGRREERPRRRRADAERRRGQHAAGDEAGVLAVGRVGGRRSTPRPRPALAATSPVARRLRPQRISRTRGPRCARRGARAAPPAARCASLIRARRATTSRASAGLSVISPSTPWLMAREHPRRVVDRPHVDVLLRAVGSPHEAAGGHARLDREEVGVERS